MKEDIRRRRQERIRQLEQGQASMHSFSKQEQTEPPDTHWDESSDRAVNQHNLAEQPSPEWSSSLERTSQDEHPKDDPEQAWKASRANWEERYGWSERPGRPVQSSSNTWLMTLRLQVAGALLVGVIAVALFQLSTPWQSKAQAFVTASLTENLNLEPIAVWYRETFGGSPAFIPIWDEKTPESEQVQAVSQLTPPLAGSVVQSFAVNLKGIEIAPSGTDLAVRSAATGRVLDVSTDDEARKTVTVQHADGYTTIYGHLSSSDVNKDDWVEAGDEIGMLPETAVADSNRTLYFAITKSGQYVDPMDVIDLD